MIDTKRYRARIPALTIAMAAFGCGDGGQTGTGAVLPRPSGSSGPWYLPVDAP
jgi:hypothetical protein